MWSRRNFWRSPTGSATRWSPTCAAPSPATATHFRRSRRHGARRRRLDVDRPDFIGHVDGRLDVTTIPGCSAQARLRVATDNPGSPNIQAGLARYPIYATIGGTFGVDQNFNRLQVSAGATVDRTDYQKSKLTDGTSTSNDDRNFNQFGGIGRVSYDLMPGVKPFVEVEGDSRVARPASSTATAMRAIPPADTSRPAPPSNSRGC